MYEKITLKSFYRKFTKKSDPKAMLTFPADVFEDLEQLAKFNKRTVKEEVLARVIKTLELNQEFMGTERLMRVIMNKKFAFENQK